MTTFPTSRRAFLRSSLPALFSASALHAADAKPNFIILLADDLGYGDVGCYGGADVRTPHVDSIAGNGARFTSGYVTAALCSPSRAGLLTGRYQQRFGHEFNPTSEATANFGLPLTETTIAQRLKKAGYATGAIGKWHLGSTPQHHPMERGFDEYYGFLGGANAYFNSKTSGELKTEPTPQAAAAPLEKGRQLPVFRNRNRAEENDYLTDAWSREAVSFISRHRSHPFFLYVAFNAVHAPLQSTTKYLDRFAGVADPRRRMLCAMASAMDDAVGAVLAKLRETGLERNTVVVFLSDNGSPTIFKAGSNGPLNGQKATYWEGGIRIPFVMQWPGRIKPGQVKDEPVISLDITRTFAAAAGADTQSLEGVDLLPFASGKAKGKPHDILSWRAGRVNAIRKGDWKLLQMGDNTKLFNLAADIGEKNDLSQSKPDMVAELRAAYDKWNQGNVKALWQGFEPPLGNARSPAGTTKN